MTHDENKPFGFNQCDYYYYLNYKEKLNLRGVYLITNYLSD